MYTYMGNSVKRYIISTVSYATIMEITKLAVAEGTIEPL